MGISFIRRAVSFAAALAFLSALVDSRGANAAPESAASPLRAVTATSDARACVPLADGGVAVATGGGLAIVAKSGTSRVLTAIDGLPETRVHAVARARDDTTLWVGTEAGAALVDIAKARVVRAIPGDAVHAIAVTGDGAYVGTWSQDPAGRVPETASVLRVRDATSAVERLAFAPGTPSSKSARGARVAALAEHEGSVWVAYADGPLSRIESGAVRPVARSGAVAGSPPTHGQALLSYATPEGQRLVLGALEGLFRIETPGTGPSFTSVSFTSVSSVDARALGTGLDGSLLVGTFGSGLLSGASSSALRGAVRDAAATTGVSSRFVTGIGNVGSARCAATRDGVFVDAGDGRFHRRPLGGLESNDVTAIAPSRSGDRVAVATFDRGLSIVTRSQSGGEANAVDRVVSVPAIDPNETVNALAWQGEGASEVLWVGTARGLVRLETGRGKLETSARRYTKQDGLPESFVRAIAVLANGQLLVGTDRGPATLDVGTDRVSPLVRKEVTSRDVSTALASPMHPTWAVAEGKGGVVFIGTTTGLYWGKLGKDTKFERASLATKELSDDWVTALAIDGEDVFVGTYAKGVVRLRFREGADRPARPHVASFGGGYVNPDGLVVLRGAVYVATMDGLLTRPRGDDTTSWRTLAGAAPGRDVTAVRFIDRERWTASRRGIGVSAI